MLFYCSKLLLMRPFPLLLSLLLCLLPHTATAQCGGGNTAFQSGERMTFELFFNWSFIWVKVGTAEWKTTQTSYAGRPAYRTHLITSTNRRADRFFVMRDTLTAYTDLQISPLHYTKHALEGKTFRVDEVKYSYPNGKCALTMNYSKNRGAVKSQQQTLSECAYDMLSMMLRARSFNPSAWKKGHRIPFLIADGSKVERQHIVFRGRENFKVEGGNIRYRCLVFSFMEREEAEEKEIVRFFITDDANHLPVRLDMNLKFGVAKAFLTSATDLRHPQTSIIKM